MARTLLKKGFNAGSGYSQVWARDMNTFVEIALEEVNPKDIRGAILVFFALQQPNNEMIDGYVLNRDFTRVTPISTVQKLILRMWALKIPLKSIRKLH